MRNILIVFILLFCNFCLGQDTIAVINTKKLISSGTLVIKDCKIVITNKLITVKMTDKKQIRQLQKYFTYDLSEEISIVDFDLQKVKLISCVDNTYTFQGKNIIIKLIVCDKNPDLLIEMQDINLRYQN